MLQMGENSDPALAIVFFHGVGYHTEFYGRFLSALCAAIHGLVVFSMDQPGHGESDGERAFIRNWSDHIDACADFVTKCRQSLTKVVVVQSMNYTHALFMLLRRYFTLIW